MKTHNLIQGSPEWLAYRAQNFNASDAPAMMGCSPYKTRAELLREVHTGRPADVDVATQKRFDAGHRAEALARPLAEEIIGEELYPVTGSAGRLSASFDGLTLDETQGFEHKALNAEIRAAFDAAWQQRAEDPEAGPFLPIYHRVQMEQQLHVSGAERILFMASEWGADGNLIEERHCWYYPDDELRANILRGWEQFERDLAAYVLPESAPAAPVGQAPEMLPALRIEITGAVTASNLAEFKASALGAIRAVNRDLQTDQHFADAEKAVKWCADVEQRLAAAKDHALSQTATIDALFKTIDDISSEARRVRLDLDKLVTRRKGELKDAEVARARDALSMHVLAVNAEISPARLQHVAELGAAIKGLKTLDSVRAKLDDAVAAEKVRLDTRAREIRENLTHCRAAGAGLEYLFADVATLVHKPADDFRTLVAARIDTHRAAEARKEAERQAAEAARIAAAEQRARDEAAAAERQRLEADARAAEQARQDEQDREDARRHALDLERQAATVPAPIKMQIVPPSAPSQPEPATLNLGAICARLGFTVSAHFVGDVLGIQPAATDKRASLYTERQFGLICERIAAHVRTLAAT
ncbi:MAG: YqaJ viral recombinase family protein, partial [Thermomonas sp.]|uniref:YqaJ viral recombinase family protein n=1 Tax=Thermomonas sp. TaxID=1971895 RepID=UPI001B42365D